MKYPYAEAKPKGHDAVDEWLALADELIAEVEQWLAEHGTIEISAEERREEGEPCS